MKNVTKNDVSFNVSDDKQFAYFWHTVFPNHWEDFTFEVLDHFLHPDRNYLDIGSWIGPTLLYAASLAKQSFGVEPDPVAYEALKANIELNQELKEKITTINKAMSFKSGTMNLYKRTRFGDSSSSLVRSLSDDFQPVSVSTLKDLVSDYQITDLSLIKMDIEGGEYLLIPAMRKYLKRYKPPLYLSLHPEFLKSSMKKRCPNSSEKKLQKAYFKKVKKLIQSLDMYDYIYLSSSERIEKSKLVQALLKNDNPIELLFTTTSFNLKQS
ncbi:FkbM family methyltransferase [Fictibacillus halophilus]|uniref:FkbM family methyltransferase n=1 Tax=Fictibacillus halophilus TaxID=1610490 RepID=A0ABV2LLZ1_9BACL|nr:FkbM family methyltransferase [Fictibacillus halophilus]